MKENTVQERRWQLTVDLAARMFQNQIDVSIKDYANLFYDEPLMSGQPLLSGFFLPVPREWLLNGGSTVLEHE